MTLEELVGTHMLTAVEQNTLTGIGYGGDDANTIAFTLDGVTYCAVENPEDGYRSSMGELVVVKGITLTNSFPPQQVEAVYTGGYHDLLTLRNSNTGEEVLRVGTSDTTDYYPCYVASFSPENMDVNSQGGE